MLHEPVPEQFAPPAIGAGAGAVTSRPTGACSASPAGTGEVWEAIGSLTAEEAPENALEKREMLLASKGKSLLAIRHLSSAILHPSFPIPAFRIPHSLVRRGDASDKLLDHLVDGHAAGVDQHGVFGRFHGGDGAGDVAGVTNAQVLEHRLEAEGPAGCL